MATSNTFSITAGVTSFACDFGATDKETIVLTISSTGAVISSNDYSVLGVAASATAGDITIEWDDAGDYVGETLIVSKFTEIDTGSPSDAMLVNFTTSGTTNPTNIQNEFAHLYDIVGQITGGTAVGTYDIADIGIVITRLNDLADDIFTTTTNSGTPAIWDGTNTLSIGGDTNVQSILTTHESRLDTAETDIDAVEAVNTTQDSRLTSAESNLSALNIMAGLPNPFATAASDVAIADAGTHFTTDNVEAALQEIASTSTAFISTARIQADAVTNAKLANMATQTIKGRNTAGTGDPEDLTASQAAGIVRSELISDAIANSETNKAPTQNAVYDQCVAPLANKQGAFGVLETAITFGANGYNTESLTSSTSRLYFAFVVVSAGTTLGGNDLSVNNYRNIRLTGGAGASSYGPTAISGEAYAHAGGAEYLNVKVFYTTVY